MPNQILDEPLFEVNIELDEQQLRLVQFKKRCLVFWLFCIGTWAVVQFYLFYILGYRSEEARIGMPTLYLNLFLNVSLFTTILLKPHKPQKNTNFLLKIVQYMLMFAALYALVLLCFAGASLLFSLLGRKLPVWASLNKYWIIYLSFTLSSGVLMLGVYFFLKPELNYEANKLSK